MRLFSEGGTVLIITKLGTKNFSLHKQTLNFIRTTRGIVDHEIDCVISNISKAFNQYTVACEVEIINAISAADIALIMPSLKSTKPFFRVVFSNFCNSRGSVFFCELF